MNRRTLKYTYRSEGGLDVDVTQELEDNVTVEAAAKKVVDDFRLSVTPLTMVNGKRIDITRFLEIEKKAFEEASEKYRLLAERIGREIPRRQKEL